MAANLCDDIRFLTDRALWETENLLKCVPTELWCKRYDEIPLWNYLYHLLYSMDRWFINPNDPAYQPPKFHTEGLNDLSVIPGPRQIVSRASIERYFEQIKAKLTTYLETLTDRELYGCPEGCEYTRFRLILGQFRHWHRHMGLVYGFLVQDTGKWPYVLNMEGEYPKAPMPNFYGDAGL